MNTAIRTSHVCRAIASQRPLDVVPPAQTKKKGNTRPCLVVHVKEKEAFGDCASRCRNVTCEKISIGVSVQLQQCIS